MKFIMQMQLYQTKVIFTYINTTKVNNCRIYPRLCQQMQHTMIMRRLFNFDTAFWRYKQSERSVYKQKK